MRLSSFYPSNRVQILLQILREIHTKPMRRFGVHVHRYAEVGGVVVYFNNPSESISCANLVVNNSAPVRFRWVPL